jgi:hypothetical protein
MIVDAGHRIRGYHGIHYCFFRGLNRCQKNWIERVVGKHGELVQPLGADCSGIRRGEGKEDVSRTVTGLAAIASQAERNFFCNSF